MVPLLLAAALALVHLFAGRLRFLEGVPRSRWLSFAGGVSVAYVFAHLLPEVAAGQQTLADAGLTDVVVGEGHVWLLALLGLVVFYGLERAAQASRGDSEDAGTGDQTEPGVFWLHMISFSLYNLLIGYVLAESEDQSGASVLLFWVAMVFHFFVNDAGLRADHKDRYAHVGRWGLALSVIGGAVLGLQVQVREATLAAALSFLAGSVVLVALKEELPDEQGSRFWPFAVGAVGYAVVLTVV